MTETNRSAVEVKVGSRNEALEMQSFLLGNGYAVSVRRVGAKSHAWNASTLPVGYEVSFTAVQS